MALPGMCQGAAKRLCEEVTAIELAAHMQHIWIRTRADGRPSAASSASQKSAFEDEAYTDNLIGIAYSSSHLQLGQVNVQHAPAVPCIPKRHMNLLALVATASTLDTHALQGTVTALCLGLA